MKIYFYTINKIYRILPVSKILDTSVNIFINYFRNPILQIFSITYFTCNTGIKSYCILPDSKSLNIDETVLFTIF